MPSSLQAEVLRIRDVFSSAADLRVPPYQRGFAWEDAETTALMKDLIEAFELASIYFLGAMVVIQTRTRGPSDVVDGQQRLTTLTIMLSVLRDLSPSADEVASLHAMIGHEAMMWGERQRWRISLNHLDMKFFREHVQTRGATLKLDRIMAAAESESQRKIADAVRNVTDELSEMSDDERARFARWVAEEVSIVKVRVAEHSLGYKVFLVLNQRGKPLSDHDILKSALFERAGFTDAEAIQHSTRWNEFANRLGSSAFEGMLKQIRFLYDRAMRGEFIDGLLHAIIPRMPVSAFINELLPRFVDAYDAIVHGNYERIDPGPEALRSLCFLRSIHHESWRAPAIKFLVENRNDKDAAARFFAGLERLAYMMQYSVKERDYRHKRYRKLMDAMDVEGGVFEPNSPLHLSHEEKEKFLDRLMGKYSNFKQRRALVWRVNAALPGGAAIPPGADATLEHIFPRTPPKSLGWTEHWSAGDIDDLTECLGNYTLVPDLVNQKAGRADFATKMQLYFPPSPAGEPQPHFSVSGDLRGKTSWKPEDVRARRDRLVGYLAQEWDLPVRAVD
ncbi:MAG: DUF262 domain-containing HNH endonuclease family protein [Alphaproteobacteria bacterium]|nr:DUF262 domain-containing HNH endonuclease family protein [Alphaproteobacteria bacterium]